MSNGGLAGFEYVEATFFCSILCQSPLLALAAISSSILISTPNELDGLCFQLLEIDSVIISPAFYFYILVRPAAGKNIVN